MSRYGDIAMIPDTRSGLPLRFLVPSTEYVAMFAADLVANRLDMAGSASIECAMSFARVKACGPQQSKGVEIWLTSASTCRRISLSS